MQSHNSVKKQQNYTNHNTLETLSDFGSDTVQNSMNAFGDIGSGIFDQLFGGFDEEPQNFEKYQPKKETKKSPKLNKAEFINLYNFSKDQEIRMIKELIAQIKEEIKYIKRADKALLNEVKDIEKISMQEMPEKPGIYHIKFLEVVLGILRSLRAKVGESGTWMQALMSKKKKRGSAFAVRSKKQGTQYSLSQELSNSRSVQ